MRDHPARRREIVAAARGIAAEQGWRAVTVRAVAGRVGCSAPALYQYFGGKDAILASIAADAGTALGDALEQAVEGVHGPIKRLRTTVRGLWDFALANPELYAAIFGLDGLASRLNGNAVELTPSAMRRVAAEVVSKRNLGIPADDLADRLAATAHGFICLALADRFPGGRERGLALLLDVFETLVKGLDRR